MFGLQLKNLKSSVVGLILVVLLAIASHFTLSAGVSMVDTNKCLRPYYSCKSDNVFYSSYA